MIDITSLCDGLPRFIDDQADGKERIVMSLGEIAKASHQPMCHRCGFATKTASGYDCSIGRCWYDCDKFVERESMEQKKPIVCSDCEHATTYPNGHMACRVSGQINSDGTFCVDHEQKTQADTPKKPPLGAPPCYIGAEKRIGELADAISRHADEARNYPGHIKLWAREILAQIALMEQVREWEKE